MNNAGKILSIFLMIAVVAIVFLSSIFNTITSTKPNFYEPVKVESEGAVRGEIATADGYHLTRSFKTYSVAIDPDFLDSTKTDIFINFFSIYTGLDGAYIRSLLSDGKRKVILKNVDAKMAKNLKELSRSLEKEGVFIAKKSAKTGRSVKLGIEIIENNFIRMYPYNDIFEPILGYVRDEGLSGIVGIEKFYDEKLRPDIDGYTKGERDVGGNIIFTKEMLAQSRRDGAKLILGLDMALQKQIEYNITAIRQQLHADEVIVGIMESKTGKVIALASSNRYEPMNIRQEAVPHIKLGAIQYIFEPGSIIKPIIFSLLLESGKINQFQMLDGHLGRYQIGNKIIIDEHKMGAMTAEDAIVFSSNIGMAQIVQRLNENEITEGLKRFGFSQKSGIDLPYEGKGNLPSLTQLRSEIYKATVSYGYGMRANFIQLLKAYNVFNNNGLQVEPFTVAGTSLNGEYIPFEHPKPQAVLSGQTTVKMHDILKKTVEKGTGKGTYMQGLEIGGKTGTAHIAVGGRYANLYNSSFFGFVNDKNKNYTIGVLVISPKTAHFASETAVPVFRSVIINLIKKNYLSPSAPILELNSTNIPIP